MSKVEELEKVIEPIVASNNFEVVDIQYLSEGGRWVVRVFIDSPEGRPVTINDCAKISEVVGAALDSADIINKSYVLEVSSPGINRPLKKPKDFIRFKNALIRVSTFAPNADGQRNFKGRIVDFQNDMLTIALEDKKTISLNIKQIAKARLEPEI